MATWVGWLVSRLRAVIERLYGGRLGSRRGHVYVWLRVIEAQLSRLAQPRRVVGNFEFVDVGQADPRVTVSVARPEEVITIPSVPDLDPWLRDVSNFGATQDVPAQVVVEMQPGVVFGEAGWVGPAVGSLLTGLGSDWDPTPNLPEISAASAAALEHGIVDVEGTVVSLFQLGIVNYSHWTLQGLPRLSLVLESLGGPDAVDTFLIRSGMSAFVRDMLTRLGIDEGQIREVEPPVGAYRAERLVAASMLPNERPSPEWATSFVRGLYPECEEPHGDELLYVERGSRYPRRVVNEDAVIAMLVSLGFTICAMDGYSVAEQARLFAGARGIVAPHGSALTNLVFASPGAFLVELHTASWPSVWFSQLARQMGVAYATVLGTETRPPRSRFTWIQDGDTVVDVDLLERTVRRMLDAR